MNEGELYKLNEAGDEIYVEIRKNPGFREDKEGLVYVCTRTPYVTSLYGQIETCGFVEKERLIPFKNTKRDQKIKEQLERATKEGIERSKTMYEIAKGTAII